MKQLPAMVCHCSDVQPPTKQKEGSAQLPVLGKRKGFGQGIEGMSELCEAEHRATARPQHLRHSGLSPWIKAAKHGGRCLEREAIPASGQSIKEESERKESQKYQII